MQRTQRLMFSFIYFFIVFWNLSFFDATLYVNTFSVSFCRSPTDRGRNFISFERQLSHSLSFGQSLLLAFFPLSACHEAEAPCVIAELGEEERLQLSNLVVSGACVFPRPGLAKSASRRQTLRRWRQRRTPTLIKTPRLA